MKTAFTVLVVGVLLISAFYGVCQLGLWLGPIVEPYVEANPPLRRMVHAWFLTYLMWVILNHLAKEDA
jgi:hypothetical protein